MVVTAACGHGQIQNLQLQWQGVDRPPRAIPNVQQALATMPLALVVRDVRQDPTQVGTFEDDGFVVRTSMNVGQYAADKIGDMLRAAGARLTEPPVAGLEIELVEYNVVEGGSFQGTVRLQVTVKKGANQTGWSKMYEGTSTRWGRTHNPENFNEALSNALAEATQRLVTDYEFGLALTGPPPAVAPPPPGAPGG
jgi:hypothetical protein